MLKTEENFTNTLNELFGIDAQTEAFCKEVEQELEVCFKQLDKTRHVNGVKVFHTMQKNKLSDIHFSATTGYGYNDLGRDTVEQIY